MRTISFPLILMTVLLVQVSLLAGCATVSEVKLTPELHAVGVYEGTDPEDDGRPWHAKCGDLDARSCHAKMRQRKRELGGEVVINVSIKDRPLVLAFTAYDKTKWIIRAEASVVIEKIILGGYHAQSVEGIPDITPLAVYTHDDSPCTRCYRGSGYFYSYETMPVQINQITGLEAASWQGRYRGVEFSIYPELQQLAH